jgi:hypothetical protein
LKEKRHKATLNEFYAETVVFTFLF